MVTADGGVLVDRGLLRHCMLLYGSDRSWLADWVRHGLQAGEKILYPVAGDDRFPAILAVLAECGVDVTATTTQGRLQALPTAQYLAPDGLAVAVRAALTDGYRSVRVVAGIGQVLTRDEYATCERLLDAVCHRYPVCVLCPYEQTGLSDLRLREFTGCHPHARDPHLDLRRGGDTVVLAGQADHGNHRLLREVVGRAAADASSEVYLDVGDLTFIAAAGWRALMQATRAAREGGGRLVMLDPSPGVAEMVTLLGLDTSGQLDIVTDRYQ